LEIGDTAGLETCATVLRRLNRMAVAHAPSRAVSDALAGNIFETCHHPNGAEPSMSLMIGAKSESESLLAMGAMEAYIRCMPTMAKEQRTQRFVARVTAADKELFQKAAAIEGRSMARFIITHVREVARQVINQSNQIRLDADESRRFVDALLTPPRAPGAALKKAMVRCRQQVKEG
jgi:uncharacterized protein (DUF1778 family)